ncbi:UNC93-like protein MFSD11 [Entamoeba marina]
MNIKVAIPYVKPLFAGLCFFVLLCGYQTTQNFQSGLNDHDGFISVALIYGTYGIAQFVTPLIVHFLTPKYSLYFASLCYVFYIGINVYIIKWLYYIASIICGFGASLLWSSSTTLLSGYEQNVKYPSYVYTLFFVPTYFNFIGNIVPLIISPSDPTILFLFLTIIAATASLLMLFVPDSPPVEMGSSLELLLSTTKSFIIPQLLLLFHFL